MKSVKRRKKSWIEDYKGIQYKDIIHKNKIKVETPKSQKTKIIGWNVYPLTVVGKHLLVNHRLVPHFKGLKRKSKDYHFEFVSITSEVVSEW